MRWPHPTVRLRLTLTYTTMFVVTGAALLGASYVLVQHREKGPAEAAQIICTAQSIGRAPAGAVQAPVGTGTDGLPLSHANCTSAVGIFYSRSGTVSASGGASVPAGGAALPDPTQIPRPAAAEVSRLTAAVKASQAHTLASFKLESAIALGLLTIVSFGLSWWMAGRALSPVHRITAAARSLSERTLHDRINLRGPNDELKQLADTFDAMLGRLDRAFHSQRRFVANASHELRTPLATERVLIDEALTNRAAGAAELRSILEQLRTNSEETERLIDALLMLARSERGVERWEPVDLAAVATAVMEQSGAEAGVAEVAVTADVEPVVVRGDRGLMERLAGNLVENAIRHNVASGWVSLTVRAERGAGVLEVANSGPVVDPTKLASLVEPFRRGGQDRSADDGGVGLGLSIVDAIVTAHGGRLDLGAPPSGGLVAQVRLPLADGPSCRRAAA